MMMKWFGCIGLMAALCLAPILALADDLGDANMILCTASVATLCLEDGECETGPPWNWNIPQFIEIDLAAMQLRTTKASGENRSTVIKNLERADGLVFLQGVEKGRAFSFVITEKTGLSSFAVARDGVTVGGFGACTPIEGRR
jgi:hypothetical protein